MLNIHHLRNATMVIETEENVILVDPMLGPISTIQAFSYIRFKAKKNPIVDLPENSSEILKKVTHCIITHQHPDHLDKTGIQFLIENDIPVTCSILDFDNLRKKGLNVAQSLEYWKKSNFLGGTIEGIPGKHGYGFIAKRMGNVMGFFIELPKHKSIYISADTVYTEAVDKVLKEYKPSLSIVASGSAQLDVFQPILMTISDILKFVKNSPGKVMANHLEALNHCPTTRKVLRKELENHNLSEKVMIPNDGETICIN